jgi:hypothetical protein
VTGIGEWVGFAGIVVGGVIAVSGQLGTARMANKSAEGAVKAERNKLLWERRTTAYVDTVQDMLSRRTRRESLTSRGDIGNIGNKPIREIQDVPETAESIRLRAVLRVYASSEVWAAFESADTANITFWISLTHLVAANHSERENPDAYVKALDRMREAREHAHAMDDRLFDMINRELSWRPEGRDREHRSFRMSLPWRQAGLPD